MANAIRLENKAEDFKKRGINPETVELWEDGRRDDDRVGSYEWWYYDFMLDDGGKVVIHYHTKPVAQGKSPVALPQPGIKITLPDGTVYEDEEHLEAADISFGEGKCDVHFGPHHCDGDLKTYHIHFEPLNGVGADLTMETLSSPWRAGDAFWEFPNDQYFTWLCVVPKGRVTGKLYYNGEEHEVSGFGYHDHQWSNVFPLTAFDHWFWCRHDLGDYTMLTFDIVTGKEFGYQILNMVFIQDKDGKVIFECTDPSSRKREVVEEYIQEATGKAYPQKTLFTFESGGQKLEYELTVKEEIHMINTYGMMPKPVQEQFDAMGIQPTYAREFAEGHMKLTGGDVEIERSSDLIYEFVYMSKDYKDAVPTE